MDMSEMWVYLYSGETSMTICCGKEMTLHVDSTGKYYCWICSVCGHTHREEIHNP